MKIRMLENTAWVSVDGAPSQMVEQGESIDVEPKRDLIIAGNPIDPWRIVVQVVRDEPQR